MEWNKVLKNIDLFLPNDGFPQMFFDFFNSTSYTSYMMVLTSKLYAGRSMVSFFNLEGSYGTDSKYDQWSS